MEDYLRVASIVLIAGVTVAVVLVSLLGPTESTSARTEAFRARCLTVGFTVEQCRFFKDGAGK